MSASGPPRPGVDLIEIERLERALERRPRLADRLFQPGELDYARRRARPARHLAARFAAKEAVLKALTPAGGGSGIALREIEVLATTPPSVQLHGRARELAGSSAVELTVSLTHSRETAAAVALALPVTR